MSVLPVFDVVVVGGGAQAVESRLPALSQLRDCGVRVRSIVEPDTSRWPLLAATAPGVSLVRDIAAVGGAHGAVITAPTRLHEWLTVECLDRGWHVLCEKPMAATMSGAMRMSEHARAAQRTLHVGYQFPYLYPVESLTAIGNTVGSDITVVHGRWLRRGGIPAPESFWGRGQTGVVADLLGHLLSLALRYLRGPASHVRAWGSSERGVAQLGPTFVGPDTARVQIDFESGDVASFDLAWDSDDVEDEAIELSVFRAGACLRLRPPGPIEGVRLAECAAVLFDEDGATHRLDQPVPTNEAIRRQTLDWINQSRMRHGPDQLRRALEIQAIQDAAALSLSECGLAVPPAIPRAAQRAWPTAPESQ